MTTFQEIWGETETRLLQQYREESAEGGLLYPESTKAGNELNRAYLLSLTTELFAALGWIDIADKYASVGTALLERSAGRKQKKLVIGTVVSEVLIEYHRGYLLSLFRSILEKRENSKDHANLLGLLRQEYARLDRESKTVKKRALRPILCKTAIAADDCEYSNGISRCFSKIA